jgi:ribose 1,5-bisphosphokinase
VDNNLLTNQWTASNNGAWIFVCGPSGCGKDSVIASAQQLLKNRSDIVFARRLITRPAHAASDHEAVSTEHFSVLLSTDQLAWHWAAHDFQYGVHASYDSHIRAGRRVVVNGSRSHVMSLAASPDVNIVNIECDPAVIAHRLIGRGRDSAQAIAERLQRNQQIASLKSDLVINNNTELAVAGQALADYLSR